MPSLTFLPNSSISLALVMYNSRSCDFRSLLFSNSSSAWAMESSNWSGAVAPFFTIFACAVTGICKRHKIHTWKKNKIEVRLVEKMSSPDRFFFYPIASDDPSTGEPSADAVTARHPMNSGKHIPW